MAIQLQVPSWLQPPSQEDRARMQIAEDQAREHAAIMLRKQVGLSRMQQEAAQLTASGVPELDARKTALINNAEYIFADNPQAVASIIHSDQANAIRARAEERLQQRVDDLHEYQMRVADAKEKRDSMPVTPQVGQFDGPNGESISAIYNPRTGNFQQLGSKNLTPEVLDIDGKKFISTPKGISLHPLQGVNMSAADKAKLNDLYSQLREKRKALEKETDETAKMEGALELAKIQKQIRIVTGEQPATKAAPVATPTAPVEKVRVTKRDPGSKDDGKSYWLPKSQLEEAKRQKYFPD